jgi:hypothetical protein
MATLGVAAAVLFPIGTEAATYHSRMFLEEARPALVSTHLALPEVTVPNESMQARDAVSFDLESDILLGSPANWYLQPKSLPQVNTPTDFYSLAQYILSNVRNYGLDCDLAFYTILPGSFDIERIRDSVKHLAQIDIASLWLNTGV